MSEGKQFLLRQFLERKNVVKFSRKYNYFAVNYLTCAYLIKLLKANTLKIYLKPVNP